MHCAGRCCDGNRDDTRWWANSKSSLCMVVHGEAWGLKGLELLVYVPVLAVNGRFGRLLGTNRLHNPRCIADRGPDRFL